MLAGSAFVALVDIFIVSIVPLTGGPVSFGASSLVLVIVALYGSALGRAWEVTGITRRG